MPAALEARLSQGFAWTGTALEAQPFEHVVRMAPAGSGSATAADMARFMRAQLDGGDAIYDAQTARAFRTPILPVPDDVNGWAHGYMIRTMPGGFRSYGHDGATELFFSNMVLIPQLGLGLFVAANTETGRALVDRLPRLVVERFYAMAPIQDRAPGDPGLLAHARDYAGPYLSTRRAFSGLAKFVSLLGTNDSVSVDRDGYLVTKIGDAVRFWVPDGAPDRFRDADGDQVLHVTLDADGRAVRFAHPRGTLSMERQSAAMAATPFRLAAVLTLLVSLALVLRRTPVARLVAIAWLLAFALLLLWTVMRGSDAYVWPGPALVGASFAATVASFGSLLLFAWRRHVLVACVFVVFAVLVALRGGLSWWA